MRSDARRNRERVIEAARSCFATQGLDAQMDDIARCAGVGVGTIYRHFPAKEDLLAALANEHFADLERFAREALEEPDPWTALRTFMQRSARRQAENRAIAEVMATQRDAMRAAAMGNAGLWEALEELVGRGQAAGVLRSDVVVRDIPMLICSAGRAMRQDLDGPPTDPDRFLAIVLDGLRAADVPALPDWDPEIEAAFEPGVSASRARSHGR